MFSPRHLILAIGTALLTSCAWAQTGPAHPAKGSPPGSATNSNVRRSATAAGPSQNNAELNPCDLNADGVVNVLDEQLAVNMSLKLIPCTADIMGKGVCNDTVVKHVLDAVLGGACVTADTPSVTLHWNASVSPNVVGYNAYRSQVSGGPYDKINTDLIPLVSYLDKGVQSGSTYYYVVTAVDSDGKESGYSGEAQVNVP